jgi:two-component system, OmpR family, phosphate regulon response regulator PhoB
LNVSGECGIINRPLNLTLQKIMKNKTRILIVDDDAQSRELLHIAFNAHTDWDVCEAANAQEAIEAVQNETPEIIILDIMMPGDKDGLDVCDFIKLSPEYKSIFVVLLTAKDKKSDVYRGMETRANMYLTKPFSPQGIVDIVTNYNSKK